MKNTQTVNNLRSKIASYSSDESFEFDDCLSVWCCPLGNHTVADIVVSLAFYLSFMPRKCNTGKNLSKTSILIYPSLAVMKRLSSCELWFPLVSHRAEREGYLCSQSRVRIISVPRVE